MFHSYTLLHCSWPSLVFNGKETAWQCRKLKFDPRIGKIPWRRMCNPLQYSCLENPMDRGAWWVTVHGVTKSWTWLSDQTTAIALASGCHLWALTLLHSRAPIFLRSFCTYLLLHFYIWWPSFCSCHLGDHLALEAKKTCVPGFHETVLGDSFLERLPLLWHYTEGRPKHTSGPSEREICLLVQELWLEGHTSDLAYFLGAYWRKKWQPSPVLLPGESHGRRCLVGCSPCSH